MIRKEQDLLSSVLVSDISFTPSKHRSVNCQNNCLES
jgi:hypothetical protein